jgi:hypothetical protein
VLVSMTIQGELGRYAELIGARKDDPRVLELLQASPHFREQEPFVDPSSGAEWIVIESVADGVRLQFRDGALAKASAEVAGSAQLDAVAHPDELIAGLDLRTATADDVVARFGAPTKRGRTALQYALDGATLTVAFLDDRVRSVTVSDGKR